MALGGLFGTAAVAVVVSLAVHVALNCPIQPLPSPRPPPPAARYRPNNLLQGLEKLGGGQLSAPEDVYVDAAAGGTLYTATRDGWLQRMHPNGSWEQWRFVGGTGLLGIAPSADGSVLVCDADKVRTYAQQDQSAGAGSCMRRRVTESFVPRTIISTVGKFLRWCGFGRDCCELRRAV
uniref:Strictosidine synthase conserved region domain-containing protein n=1 Tax=Triticum urartu TaxID=4572 RepID=A0A8R7PCD3_TRIUA